MESGVFLLFKLLNPVFGDPKVNEKKNLLFFKLINFCIQPEIIIKKIVQLRKALSAIKMFFVSLNIYK